MAKLYAGFKKLGRCKNDTDFFCCSHQCEMAWTLHAMGGSGKFWHSFFFVCFFVCLSHFWTVKFVNAVSLLRHLNWGTVLVLLDKGSVIVVHAHLTCLWATR